jgi:hypothetical protein
MLRFCMLASLKLNFLSSGLKTVISSSLDKSLATWTLEGVSRHLRSRNHAMCQEPWAGPSARDFSANSVVGSLACSGEVSLCSAQQCMHMRLTLIKAGISSTLLVLRSVTWMVPH